MLTIWLSSEREGTEAHRCGTLWDAAKLLHRAGVTKTQTRTGVWVNSRGTARAELSGCTRGEYQLVNQFLVDLDKHFGLAA